MPPDLSRCHAYGAFNTGFSRIPSDLARRTQPVCLAVPGRLSFVSAASRPLRHLPDQTALSSKLLRPPPSCCDNLAERTRTSLGSPAPHGAPAPRGAQALRGAGRYQRTATRIRSGGNRNPVNPDCGEGTRPGRRCILPPCPSTSSVNASDPGEVHREAPGGNHAHWSVVESSPSNRRSSPALIRSALNCSSRRWCKNNPAASGASSASAR
jgi:hypothetical protein